MRKKTIKIIAMILTIILLLFVINSSVFALQSGDQVKQQADAWINKGAASNPISADKVASVLKPVANILLAIGSVLIVIMGVVMGIKYLSASPDQQGQLKKQLFGLFVSAVVLYGAYGIWQIVYLILKELFA